MKNFKLKIELISDLCSGDGSVFNSFIDVDCCHDSYGLPYIPAKRIKGLIRECALELNDWGEKIDITRIFGNEKTAGSLILDNAYLKDYEGIKKSIVESNNAPIFHPQNILNYYTYIRNQTAIDRTTGAAKDHSLRTMRVVKRGNVFFAQGRIEDFLFNDFSKCAKILTNIGLSRTRGLGSVKVSIEDDNRSMNEPQHRVSCSANSTCLEYSIELLEPVLLKDVSFGEAASMDYIAGSKVLGLIINGLKKECPNFDYTEFISSDFKVTNGYLAIKDDRSKPVPACIYGIKNNSTEYVNKLAYDKTKDEKRQLSQKRSGYMWTDNENKAVFDSVDCEEHYHHKRPADKSIGRAVDGLNADTGDSVFYTVTAISAGQCFKGMVFGSKAQISLIANNFFEEQVTRIGNSRDTEYGKVMFRLKKNTIDDGHITVSSDFAVVLNAPTIIYNENAFYSCDGNDLIDEIKEKLNIACEVGDRFINYGKIGGYNVTWAMRLPTIMAFEKGTVLKFKNNSKMTLPKKLFIGERTREGFGEAEIVVIDNNSATNGTYKISTSIKETDNNKKVKADDGLAKKIAELIFEKQLRNAAIDKAEEFGKEENRPVVSNMLLMLNTSDSILNMENAIKERYTVTQNASKEKKNTIATKILDCAKNFDVNSKKEDFETLNCIESFPIDEEKEKYKFLRYLLIEIKYRIRQNKSK